VPIHVPRLLAEVLLAEGDGLIEIAVLAVFVGQGRKEAPRVFLVSLLQVIEP
jgi:hypothetical protein